MATVLNKPLSAFKTLLDIVLPPVCYVCRKACSGRYGLCDECLGNIRHILPPQCPKCGRHILRNETMCNECHLKKSYVEKAWSCCYYKDTIRECVHLFKYNGYVGLVDIFKDIMVDFVKRNRIHENIDLVVPVPIYPAKKRERTYNHAEIIARALAKSLLLAFDSKNLKKIKWTRSQSELDKEKRLKNVKDTFLAVDKTIFSRKNILLVDDVYTTGATVNECAKALSAAGARNVFSLTLARGV